MDLAYWKSRCRAAEDALRRARSRVWVSPERQRILRLLADLKHGEKLETGEVARRLGLSHKGTQEALRKLYESGLVERTPGRGCKERKVHWWLGHLVQVQEMDA